MAIHPILVPPNTFRVPTDTLSSWGTQRDVVAIELGATLGANTAPSVGGVLLGTVVGSALAAGSFILSNTGLSSDTSFYGNRAGNSEQFLFHDASEGTLTLYARGVARILLTSTGGSFTGTWSDLGTVTTVDINGGTIDSLTAFSLRDTSGAFDVTITMTDPATISAARTLTLGMGNVAHTVNFGTTANTITFPNAASGTVPFLNLAQTWTATQTFGTIAATTIGAHTVSGNLTVAFGANIVFDRSGSYADQFLDGSNNWAVRTGDGAPGTLTNRLLLSSGAATATLTLSATTLALGSNNLTMTGTISATGARVTQSYHTNITSTNAVTVDSWGRSKKNIRAYTQDAWSILKAIEVIVFQHRLNRDPSGRTKLGVRAESIQEPLALVQMDYGHGLGTGPALDTMGLTALNTKVLQLMAERIERLEALVA